MAETLLSVVKWVARKVQLNPDITIFSDIDESADLVDYVNDAYVMLAASLGKTNMFTYPQLVTFNTTVTQQNYNITNPVTANNIDMTSFVLTNGTSRNRLIPATQRYLRNTFIDATTYTAQPQYVAIGANYIELYPIPDNAYTVSYNYSTSVQRLVNTTDTFVYSDEWVNYIKNQAASKYLFDKGFSNYEMFATEAALWYGIIVASLDPTYIYSPEVP